MDRVFSFLLWPKREALGPWKQGRKKRGSITCRTDRANEANKMFIIWLCWLFRFLKGWSRARGLYGYLRTWNWPITAREISQPYNKIQYNTIQYNTTQHNTIQYNTIQYIPLISRVRGPYGKLWTEFFPSFYGPSAKCAGHENKEGKNEDP